MKTKTELPELLSNKEYADAFHNYFFLVGCGKKRMASPFLKKMKELEKTLAVSK